MNCQGLMTLILVSCLWLAVGSAEAAKYVIMVSTGDIEEASTLAQVSIRLHGEKGVHKFDLPDEEFPRNSTQVNRFHLPRSLGKIRSILVKQNNEGASPNWFLSRVTIFETDGRKRRTYNFPCERWFSKTDDDKQTQRMLYPVTSLFRYQVDVYTGDKPAAGTDARVRIALQGSGKKVLRPYQLDCAGNPFERGQVDRFTIATYSLGELRRLALHQDKRGHSPDWYVEKVSIRCLETNQSWLFPIKKWLKGKTRKCSVKPLTEEKSEKKK